MEDYLNDPESEDVLTVRKYRYPGSDREYDLYCFMGREEAEFVSKDPDKHLKIVSM